MVQSRVIRSSKVIHEMIKLKAELPKPVLFLNYSYFVVNIFKAMLICGLACTGVTLVCEERLKKYPLRFYLLQRQNYIGTFNQESHTAMLMIKSHIITSYP